MTTSRLILSKKYKAFMRYDGADREFLEGTTAAGKTTVGAVKFLLKCAQSTRRLHIIAGLDLGTLEKNIITADMGLMDVFGPGLLEYNGNGSARYKLPHLILHTANDDRVILLLGYDDRARWKKALGGQYGCLYVDEINIADMDFIREASMRCDYLMATLNPDDPALPVYGEYINHARPIPGGADRAPQELLDMLDQKPRPGWTWWFFDFMDNASLPPEKIEQIRGSLAPGTKIYKNKIQGLRGRATGLVFANFEESRHVIRPDAKELEGLTFDQLSCGVDTAYSQKSPDTIAICLLGITKDGVAYVLAEKTYNNRDLAEPLAPSDTVRRIVEFLDRCKERWGMCRHVFIDSADQATLTEARKWKRSNPSLYLFDPAWKQTKILDRINMELGWLQTGHFRIMETCPDLIREMGAYSWKEGKDNAPEDGNDHMINAAQYAFLPYVKKIGANRI